MILSKKSMIIKTVFGKLYWDLESIPEKSTVTFLNPYSYLLTRKTGSLHNIDYIGVDGMLLKWIFNLFLIKKILRKSFDATSLAPRLFSLCETSNKSVYFIGSTEANIKNFHWVIKQSNPILNIVGFRGGYFNSEDDQSNAVDLIIKLSPDFVIVGMGSPHQENFVLRLKRDGFDGVAITCGGYFHQTTKKTDYYPKFFDKYNLRWVYRILDEPKLIIRYFFIYPKALCILSIDLFFFKLSSKNI